jgi:hypothetical protein
VCHLGAVEHHKHGGPRAGTGDGSDAEAVDEAVVEAGLLEDTLSRQAQNAAVIAAPGPQRAREDDCVAAYDNVDADGDMRPHGARSVKREREA